MPNRGDFWVIIAAGGESVRFGGDVPKQFLKIDGLPLFAHSVEMFKKCGAAGITVVVPQNRLDYAEKLFSDPIVNYISGGKTRQSSVFEGLKYAKQNCHSGIVLIHDAARPFVTERAVCDVVEAAQKYGAAFLGASVTDTVKVCRKAENGAVTAVQTLDRESLIMAQTPQGFEIDLIIKAHEEAEADNASATDDCALCERIGIFPVVVEGNHANLKITYKSDYEGQIENSL